MTFGAVGEPDTQKCAARILADQTMKRLIAFRRNAPLFAQYTDVFHDESMQSIQARFRLILLYGLPN